MFMELHREEKREDGDRGDQEEKRGIKRGESKLASNHFPKKGACQGYILSPCLFNLYAEYIMINSDWRKHKLESRFTGQISITSDMQMTPPL